MDESKIKTIESARRQRQVDTNMPGVDTVTARLQEALVDIGVGDATPQKCVIILLDDTEGAYDVKILAAGMNAPEASFLCDYSHDLLKDCIQ
jgi:hypothetical protein